MNPCIVHVVPQKKNIPIPRTLSPSKDKQNDKKSVEIYQSFMHICLGKNFISIDRDKVKN